MVAIIIVGLICFGLYSVLKNKAEAETDKTISNKLKDKADNVIRNEYINSPSRPNTKSTITKPVEKPVSTHWEIVPRKSERWFELGFCEGTLFPGYGKLYNREFEVWYCDVGSKERKDIQKLTDVFPLNYAPKGAANITGPEVYLEWLQRTGEYETLKTGLDAKNRKRWYFGLVKYTPTGIETTRAIETEEETYEEEKIEVPDGWRLVKRKSDEWFKLGFNDDEQFPGYGNVYERTFEVWYCNVGSKEKIKQPDYTDKAVMSPYVGRLCGDLRGLQGKNIQLEKLSKTQGYELLFSGLDNSERKRWYFGLKKTEPSYIFTTSAD